MFVQTSRKTTPVGFLARIEFASSFLVSGKTSLIAGKFAFGLVRLVLFCSVDTISAYHIRISLGPISTWLLLT
jgi:hypothetical protein